jgi:tripartite-type tricarboxylate transporter receptor subunit TctC
MKRLLAFLIALIAAAPAWAQAWPSKPVRLIVPFPAGGAVDNLARALTPLLTERLGQQIVIETRGGAGGSVGTAVAAKAPPDGYTLLMVFDTHAVNPFLVPNLPFDTEKDFAPISLIAKSPLALVANPKVPANTVAELIALAKSKPTAVNYATVGSGSLGHLALTLLQKQTGTKLTHVPYRGGAPAMTDLVAGQVELGIFTGFLSKPQIEGKTIKPIAVTSGKRSAALPEVPTIAESGVPGFDVTSWFGLLAPAGTPRPAIERVHAELTKVLADQDVKERLTGQALDIVGSTPDEFGRFIAAELGTWERVVKENEIKAD